MEDLERRVAMFEDSMERLLTIQQANMREIVSLFSVVNSRLDAMETRFGGVEQRLRHLEAQMTLVLQNQRSGNGTTGEQNP